MNRQCYLPALACMMRHLLGLLAAETDIQTEELTSGHETSQLSSTVLVLPFMAYSDTVNMAAHLSSKVWAQILNLVQKHLCRWPSE